MHQHHPRSAAAQVSTFIAGVINGNGTGFDRSGQAHGREYFQWNPDRDQRRHMGIGTATPLAGLDVETTLPLLGSWSFFQKGCSIRTSLWRLAQP